jgi:ubiquinone/menaquinone biosynthesis C-methylase UbiE
MSKLKALARATLPQPLLSAGGRSYRSLRYAVRTPRAKRRFARAAAEPAWLPPARLEELQGRYRVRLDYGYDPDTLERRGHMRARQIAGLVGDLSRERAFLEIGCADGMIGAALCEQGQRVSGVDMDDSLDQRAVRAGVAFVEADAARLPFGDESFDVVYSYNTFEHVAQPDAALSEAIRVLRPGGRLYLDFGPLYFSPFGLHAYDVISVPYCQHLFAPQTLSDFLDRHGHPPLPDYVNGWPIERWRALWRSHEDRLDRLDYLEQRDLTGLHLISRYPTCFRSKTDSFDDLVVSQVKALFEKRGATRAADQRAS